MIRHQPELITLKKEKLIGLPYIVLMDLFILLHAHVGNLEFLGKNATIPQYVLVVVDLYWKLFYDEVKSKRKNKRMRLQVDKGFQQVKIKNLNDENNVEMFTSSVRGEKAFAA